MDEIVSEVVDELVQVVKALKGTNITTLELNSILLERSRSVLEGLKPLLKALLSMRGDSAERVAKDLAHKINQNKALRKALVCDQKITSRFIFQLAIGLFGLALQIIA